jgi:phosphate transport system substrate-binding protein
MFKRVSAALLATCLTVSIANAGTITGTGATFPEPVYKQWAATYSAQTHNGVNYQGIGSSGGIRAIKAHTVDFAGTDKPLTEGDLNASGLYQFPTVIGGVVPVINVPGVAAGQIKLDGKTLGDIYLGAIRKWNDGRIHALNPKMNLPNMPISVVHRSDGSGTSFLFTTYLSLVNADWRGRVGGSDSVSWPTGLGGKGNDGVSALVRQTQGSIGYVEYAFAKKNHETYVQMQNRKGAFVMPTAANFGAAAAGANWAAAKGNFMLLLNQPGASAWPITGATFILVDKNQKSAEKGADVLKFFDWAYKGGDGVANSLDYVPMPAGVKALVRKQWAANVKFNGKAVYISH